MSPKEPERIMVTVRLPRAILLRARHFAVDAEQSFQDLVADALAFYLKEKGGSK